MAGCCWILQVLQRPVRREFETGCEGWNLDARRCSACASQHSRESYRGSADSSPVRCAARRCYSVPRATAVSTLGLCQTTEGQMAADWLGARDSAYVIPGSRAREELAQRRESGAPEPVIDEAALQLHPVDPVFGSAWLSPVLWTGHVPPMLSSSHQYWPASERPACYEPHCFECSCRA